MVRPKRSVDGQAITGDDYASLAAALGIESIRFVELSGTPDMNACLYRERHGYCVGLSEGLTRQPSSVRHWVVAHELVHLVKHHGLVLRVWSVLVLLILLVTTWRLGLVAGVVVGPSGLLVHRWLGRAFERQADIEACRRVPRPDIRDLHAMLVTTPGDLAPSRFRRLMATHPAPAERLELLSRL
ncbi:MAG: M48 family metalloprotease [Acidimicrobiales bacterium]